MCSQKGQNETKNRSKIKPNLTNIVLILWSYSRSAPEKLENGNSKNIYSCAIMRVYG